MINLKVTLITTLLGIVTQLITGKFLKKALALIVRPFVKKTKNTVDDELLQAAEEDLGIAEEK